MVRTVISLDPVEKKWLDREARKEGRSMNRMVRIAVQELRKKTEAGSPSFDRLLELTRGIWTGGNPLAYQTKLRREWERKG